MTPDQRHRLEHLKAQSRKRVARADAGQYFRPLIPHLRRARYRCRSIGVKELSVTLSLITKLEGQDERLLWTHLKGAVRSVWQLPFEREHLFVQALGNLTSAGDRVVVAWHTHAAGLLAKAEDVARLAPLILDSAPVVWVVPFQGPPWIIEAAQFDREICFAPLSAGSVPKPWRGEPLPNVEV